MKECSQWLVTISQINKDGKLIENDVVTDNKIGVSRIIINAKAKRGYEIVAFTVVPYTTLI